MITLFHFPRSSASYRVRIALNLKGVTYQCNLVDFRKNAQRSDEFLARNPQGLVPTLEIDGRTISQSLAIIDYLESTRPLPALLPQDPWTRSRVLSMAMVIACDIHPLNNLRVLEYLRTRYGAEDAAVADWYAHWIETGLAALEHLAADFAESPFLTGTSPGLFEVCLVPQLSNARRYAVNLSPYPRLLAIDARANALESFASAAPSVG
jgi:maleylacetoacetate isomerase